MTVPSNLIPTRITQLPLAQNPTPQDTVILVQGGVTKQASLASTTAATAVPVTRRIDTGGGLVGGGDLSQDRTISLAPYFSSGIWGGASFIPVISVDQYGRVDAASQVALTFANVGAKPTTLAGYGITDGVNDDRRVDTAGSLVGGGRLNANRTLSLQNDQVTPGASKYYGTDGTGTKGFFDITAGGTVQFVALTMPSDVFAVAGSPVTTSGTFAVTLATQAPNQIFAGPASGVANAAPAFRALVAADLPVVPVAKGGTGATDAPTALTNLGAVPITRQVATGTGLTGGGNLSGDRTISLANTAVSPGTYGSASQVAQVTVDAQGRLTSATNVSVAIDASAVISGALPITRGGTGAGDAPTALVNLGAVPNTRQVSAGTGLTGGGNLSTDRTISLANTAVTPGTYGTASQVAQVAVDAQGRITSAANVAVAIDAAAVTTGTLPVVRGGTGAATLTGYVKGNGTSAFTASPTIPNGDLQNSSLTIGSTPIALGGTATTISGLTTLTLTQNPVNPLEAATKQYVDAAVEGLNVHAAAVAATTANLTATYNNGAAGVGATLTNAGAQAAFAVDGYTAALNDRILVKNQSAPAQNGVYTVTTLGSGSTNWVLTRSTDMDTAGSGADQMGPGDYFFVVRGTQNGGTSWIVTTPLPITIGTTPITFTQFAGPGTYTAGAGLTLTGTQFSVTDTGVTPASYGTASSVPTIALNSRGQATSASNTPIAIDATQIASGTLGVPRGGTGLNSYTQGDLLYASSASTLAALPDVATGNALISGGVGADPAWGKIGLTTHVSGTLPIANGGTNSTATPTAGGAAYGTGSAFAFTAAGVSGQILRSNGAGAPTWSGIDGGTF